MAFQIQNGALTFGAGPTLVASDTTGAAQTPVLITASPAPASVLSRLPNRTMLEIAGTDAANARFNLDAFSATGLFTGRRANGTAASPAAIPAGSTLMAMTGAGYDGAAYGGDFGLNIYSTETFAPGAHGTGASISVVTQGSTAVVTPLTVVSNTGTVSVGATGGIGGDTIVVGGTLTTLPSITSGAGVPADVQPSGSIKIRTDGSLGAHVYISNGGGTWTAVAGV